MKEQTLYISLDDSGKLSKKENVCVYAGLVFFSKKEKDKFITEYRSIINDIKCHYCQNDKNNCNKICPEIKNINILPKNKRRIMNYLKKYYIIGCVIKNKEIYNYIINDKASKGRYIDYALKRLIKETVKNTIQENIIDKNLPLKLVVNIDEQTTKSNGYYNLKEGLKEELKRGIINYNYATNYKPIINSDFILILNYQQSNKCYLVQAADLLAGTLRKIVINNELDKNNYYDLKIFLP